MLGHVGAILLDSFSFGFAATMDSYCMNGSIIVYKGGRDYLLLFLVMCFCKHVIYPRVL